MTRFDRLTPASLRLRAGGLTQAEVASIIGKKTKTISQWEQFRRVPRLTLEETRLMMVAYKASLDELIEAFGRLDVID